MKNIREKIAVIVKGTTTNGGASFIFSSPNTLISSAGFLKNAVSIIGKK